MKFTGDSWFRTRQYKTADLWEKVVKWRLRLNSQIQQKGGQWEPLWKDNKSSIINNQI